MSSHTRTHPRIEGDGGGGAEGQGGGGGHAGIFPPDDWLRELPLLFSEKEALRIAFVGGAALQVCALQ